MKGEIEKKERNRGGEEERGKRGRGRGRGRDTPIDEVFECRDRQAFTQLLIGVDSDDGLLRHLRLSLRRCASGHRSLG
jgi:hypothetical protein